MRKRILLVALALVACGFLAGCGNTVDGMGRDIEHMGEKIQDL